MPVIMKYNLLKTNTSKMNSTLKKLKLKKIRCYGKYGNRIQKILKYEQFYYNLLWQILK